MDNTNQSNSDQDDIHIHPDKSVTLKEFVAATDRCAKNGDPLSLETINFVRTGLSYFFKVRISPLQIFEAIFKVVKNEKENRENERDRE